MRRDRRAEVVASEAFAAYAAAYCELVAALDELHRGPDRPSWTPRVVRASGRADVAGSRLIAACIAAGVAISPVLAEARAASEPEAAPLAALAGEGGAER